MIGLAPLGRPTNYPRYLAGQRVLTCLMGSPDPEAAMVIGYNPDLDAYRIQRGMGPDFWALSCRIVGLAS